MVNILMMLCPLQLLLDRLVMSSHLSHPPALPFSLERQPPRPAETTADPLQLAGLASRMLRAGAKRGHGQGQDRLSKGHGGEEGLSYEGRCGRLGDEEKGFVPFQLVFSSSCSTDRGNR